MTGSKRVQVLAFYLPQYHPIPENDRWWGEGFTEWTNTCAARPLFRNHVQPHLPADLGYYDLRVPETRLAQAELAKNYGVDGFCYWHYWFGNGKKLLDRPFREVLHSGQPDFPFCLAWANQSWTGVWHGLKDNILIGQTYPGEKDYTDHFYDVLPAFRDKRYIKIDGKPLFIVYSPQLLPDPVYYTGLWRKLARENGLPGIHFIGIHYINWDHTHDGFDEKSIHQPTHYIKMLERYLPRKINNVFSRRVARNKPMVVRYRDVVRNYRFEDLKDKDFIPTVVPNWDNTPRLGNRGWVFHRSSPRLFEDHFREAYRFVKERNSTGNILFIKSWNEWAEGNYLEPDKEWGRGYLEAIHSVVLSENDQDSKKNELR